MPDPKERARSELRLSVVIPTFDRAGSLPRVVDRVLADPATSEVVVVVDASPDRSGALLHDYAGREDRLRPLVLDHNVGPAQARHRGALIARGDVLLFLDDDVFVEDGFVAGHLREHVDAPRRLVQGYMPTALPAVRRPGQYATYDYAESYENHCVEYDRDPQAVLLNLWGGTFSVRRDDYLAACVGFERFPRLYHEDRDLGLRFLRAGLRPVFRRDLSARHHYQRGWSGFLRDAYTMGAGLRVLHHLHGDLLGVLDPAALLSGHRWKRALLLRAYAPPVRGVVRRALHGGVLAAGAARRFTLELRLARLASRLEQYAGARDYVVEPGSLTPGAPERVGSPP